MFQHSVLKHACFRHIRAENQGCSAVARSNMRVCISLSVKQAGVGDDGSKQNRAEKKSRKAMQKLGMKSITGIIRVTVKKSKVSAARLCLWFLIVIVPQSSSLILTVWCLYMITTEHPVRDLQA